MFSFPAGLVLDRLDSDAFLECDSEAFEGKARSDMSEFGAVARIFGDRFLGAPCEGGGSDILAEVCTTDMRLLAARPLHCLNRLSLVRSLDSKRGG